MQHKIGNQYAICLLILVSLRPGSIGGKLVRDKIDASVVPLALVSLDESNRGAGRFCPETLTGYFDALNALLDTEDDVFTPVKGELETSGGTGNVFSGEIEKDAQTSFLFRSEFTGVNQDQVTFIESLFEEGKFSEEVDPTFKPGTQKTIRDTTLALGETSNLERSEFVFLMGLDKLDRELVKIGSKKEVNSTCSLYVFPSVSDKWIGSPEFLNDPSTAKEVANGSPLIRAQSIYPSGDRLCIRPGVGIDTFDVQVIHIVTSLIGGLMSPLFNKGLFDASQANAYLTEAQVLEDKVNALA